MNGKERIEAVLNGRWPDKRPVMIHNFRMAAFEAGYSMGQYRSNPNRIARAHIQAVEKYKLDGVFLDIDTATTAEALGVPVDLPESEPARTYRAHPQLTTLENVKDLPVPNIGACERVQIWVESCRLLRKHFGDEIWVRGNTDQMPFSVAGMMRGLSDWMMDLVDPDAQENVHRLLNYCTRACKQFVRLMIQAGAHAISHGDSPAGPDMVSPAIYSRFAAPYEKQIIDFIHSHKTPHLLHICGNTVAILNQMQQTGTDGLELDYKTDIQMIHRCCKDKVAVSGILDPSGVMYAGTPEIIRRECRKILDIYRDSPRFIFCSGCALPPETPPENIYAFVETIREA